MRQNLREITGQFPGQTIILLAPVPEMALQDYNFIKLDSALQMATPLELALEILEPDIRMRGLKLIPNEKIVEILARITASLDKREELSRFGGYRQIAPLLPGVFESIIKMRRSARTEQVLAAEWGEDGSSLLGRIRNEYELNLEIWGCLDEAAVFCQAAALLEAGVIARSERIIVVTQEFKLEPVVFSFLKALMELGCQRVYGIELLIQNNQ